MQPRERRLQLSLFVFFVSVYLLFAGDHFAEKFYSFDETLVAMTTVSLASGEGLRFSPEYGETTAKFGILQSVVALPFYMLAHAAVPLLGGRHDDVVAVYCLYLTNAFVTALLATFFYFFSRWLRYPRGVALGTTIALGLTTILFPYARFFFSEPLVALLLLVSVYFLMRFARGGRTGLLAWSSAFLGLSLLARIDNAALLPVYLFAIAAAAHRWEPEKRPKLSALAVAFAGPLLCAAGVVVWVQYLRFGGCWRTGYGGESFSTPPFAGVFGLLASPGRGLLVYSPPLLIIPFVARHFFRHRPLLGVVIPGILAIKLLLFAQWWSWQGGWSWGSRFLLPVTPLLFLMLNEAILRWRRYGFSARLTVLLLFAAGFLIQLPGLLANPNKFGNSMFTVVGGDENQFLFIPQLSFLAGNLELLRMGRFDHFAPAFAENISAAAAGAMVALLLLTLVFSARWMLRLAEIRPLRHLRSFSLETSFVRLATGLLAANALIFIVSIATVISLKIPRQIAVQNAGSLRVVGQASDALLIMDESTPEPLGGELPVYIWEGWIEAPLSGDYRFDVTSAGSFHIRLAGQTMTAGDHERQQFVRSWKLQLDRGLARTRVEYRPWVADQRVFRMHWTTPGFGIHHAAISSERFFGHPPSAPLRLLLALNRFKWSMLALTLAFLIACDALRASRRMRFRI